MEIKKTAVTETAAIQRLKPGELLRVRVISKINTHDYLVEFRDASHHARFVGMPQSRLFIAQIKKLYPRLELKFVKDLEKRGFFKADDSIARLLMTKKSFIQKMINSDNFFKRAAVLITEEKRLIKDSLKNAVKRLHEYRFLARFSDAYEFYTLQNLSNMCNAQSFYLLLPVVLRKKRSYSELRITGSGENGENGFILTVDLGDERKIIFTGLIDYEAIHCSISTNNSIVKREVEKHMNSLVAGLKSLYYNKKITVQMVPYGRGDTGFYKKIDIKM